VEVNFALKIAGALSFSDAGFSNDGRAPAAAVCVAPVFAGEVFPGAAGVWAPARMLADRTMIVAIAFMMTDCTKRRADWGTNIPITCMMLADGHVYSSHGIAGSLTLDASMCIGACLLAWWLLSKFDRRSFRTGLEIPEVAEILPQQN
jgi:hypothetical protein